MMKAISIVKDGIHLGDIGSTIQTHVEAQGFSVVQDFCGHGIGQKFHEDLIFFTTEIKGLEKNLKKE